MGKTYKSYQGREIDMEKIMTSNELMPAVGNTRVNARGDELGPGGKIVKKREEVMAEYYEKKPTLPREQQDLAAAQARKSQQVQAEQVVQTHKRGQHDSKRQNTSLEE